MYDFLKRPSWIVSHILIAALVVTLVGLGFWQRSRYLEERDAADAVEARATGEPVPLDEVVPDEGPPSEVSDAARFHRVLLSGTYDATSEVLIRNRTQAGAPGAWVLTPLVQEDGTAVPVVRGWVPFTEPKVPDPPFGGPGFGDALPPPGPVTVTGLVVLTQERGSFGATDPAEGRLNALSRLDLGRFGDQLAYPIEPVAVVLQTQEPPQPGGLEAVPRPVELELPSPSQNFSYMMQWWFFAAIAAAGYPLVLRKVALNRSRGDQVPVEEPPAPNRDRVGSGA